MKLSLRFALLTLILGSAVPTLAAPSCKTVEKACRAAGHKKKADLKSCVTSVAKGEPVEGVSVSSKAVKSCKRKKGF